MWELNFFVKHFLEAYRGVSLTPAVREALDEECLIIADELAGEPRVLCHRDYHSRNLMLHERRLYIIDFQDARMGPDTYDLASLLRDSYVDLTEARVDELIRSYLELRRPIPGDARGVCRISPPVRPDVGPAQSESVRHLRPSNDFAQQSRVHPVHPADAELRSQEPGTVPALRPIARTARICYRGQTPFLRFW